MVMSVEKLYTVIFVSIVLCIKNKSYSGIRPGCQLATAFARIYVITLTKMRHEKANHNAIPII